MSPRPRLPKTQWAEDSIRVEVRPAGLTDEPENQKVFAACLSELNEVRLRLMVSCYGPGTETAPKSKYYFLIGESATVHARGLDEVTWFRESLLTWLKSLDGVRLEKVEEAVDGL
jgi:hypothetical protein